MIVIAALIGFNLTDGLQRHVPGYTSALQNNLGGNSAQLQKLTGDGSATDVKRASGNLGGRCTEAARRSRTAAQLRTSPVWTGGSTRRATSRSP